jgi:hypothetical protein
MVQINKYPIIIGIIIIILSTGLSGCYDYQLSKGPSEDNSDTSSTALTANIGETVKGKELEVTLKSAETVESFNWTGGATGYEYIEYPDEGKIYIIISVKLKQIGTDSEYVYPGEFWIIDSNNYKYDCDNYGTYQMGGGLKSTTLYQNLLIEGDILFQIPNNASGLRVQYNFASFWDEPKLVEWIL